MTIEEARQELIRHRPERPYKTEGRRLQRAIDIVIGESELVERWRRFDTKNVGRQLEGDEITFYDGIVYVITETGRAKKIILCGEYDKGISLADIRNKHKGKLVIFDDALRGSIYRYGNHGEFWEQVGMTIGYA